MKMIEEKIHVETSFSSLIKKNEELCGDKVAIRYCDQFYILVLADGHVSGTVDARDATKEQIGLMMTNHDAKEAQA